MTNPTATLIEQAQEGDNIALDRLVEENTGLVRSIALRFMGRGVDFEDLCQIGHIGMLKAIRNFDISRICGDLASATGCRFGNVDLTRVRFCGKQFVREQSSLNVKRIGRDENFGGITPLKGYVARGSLQRKGSRRNHVFEGKVARIAA